MVVIYILFRIFESAEFQREGTFRIEIICFTYPYAKVLRILEKTQDWEILRGKSNRAVANGPGTHLLFGDSQNVENILEAGPAQAHVGHAFEFSFCVISNTQAGLAQHQYIIGSVSNGHGLVKKHSFFTRDHIDDPRLVGTI